jgi:hypothetical protein
MNLSTVLLRLGERESGTARLEEANAAYRESLAGIDPRTRAARLGQGPDLSRLCDLASRRAGERDGTARGGRRRLS